jgi:hypothetical protein
MVGKWKMENGKWKTGARDEFGAKNWRWES